MGDGVQASASEQGRLASEASEGGGAPPLKRAAKKRPTWIVRDEHDRARPLLPFHRQRRVGPVDDALERRRREFTLGGRLTRDQWLHPERYTFWRETDASGVTHTYVQRNGSARKRKLRPRRTI